MRIRSQAKYRNIKSGGFDSKREARRYAELLLLERAGHISDLRRQVTFELIPAQYVDGKCVERSAKYVADFVYWRTDDPMRNETIEDSKGIRTPKYILQRKLMLFVHGIRVVEV